MLNLCALPIFDDNYIWVLEQNRKVIAVDPGDAAPLQRWLELQQFELAAILITHHHADHIGGLASLAHPALPIYGPKQIDYINRPLQGGESLSLLGENFQVITTPGHTLNHLCYFGAGYLFAGDTLFSAGCGRLFEGTPAQMYASLKSLAQLPNETMLCCTHEYTQSNLRFALTVDPNNPALQQRANEVASLRAQGLSSLPSTLAIELATNPFLRCDQAAIGHSARQHDQQANTPEEVFAALRHWKDHYR